MIAAELGEATYRKLFAKAAESFPDQAALEGFLASIERPEARALIYESILALAAADSISAEEEPLMAWLHETWKIQWGHPRTTRAGRASGLRGVACVVAAVAFALSLTASVARAADSGIEIGARTGYALSAGNRGTTADGMNAPVANYVQGFFPLWLDLGYRFDPALYLGGFFSYGFGIVNDASQTTCREANNSCSASDTRLGVMGRYTFPLTGALAPWLGLGVGYEWGSFSWSGQSPLLSGTYQTHPGRATSSRTCRRAVTSPSRSGSCWPRSSASRSGSSGM